MFPMKIEHHEHFTAVYIYGNLALMFVAGTMAARKAISEGRWHTMATIACTD